MCYSLKRVGDADLLRRLALLVTQDNVTTAQLLSHIAEVDARRLYLPAGYDSMQAYCVRGLHLAEGSASKRIWAARTAREFPAIFSAVAEGRLHLSAVCLLAPCLTKANAGELVAAATHQTKAAIERLLAERFPRTESLPLVEFCVTQHSPGNVAVTKAEQAMAPARGPVRAISTPPSRIEPIAHDRVALHLSMSRSAHEDLEHARALLGHQIPDGDLGAVAEMAFRLLVERLERRKFAVTKRPANATRRTKSRRHIPAAVKRAVWHRDQGSCTFVGEGGRRCGSSRRLEFDHVEPVARGGGATVDNLQLRCRAHNQYAAEQTFGAAFIGEKRAAVVAKRRVGPGQTEAEARLATGRPEAALPARNLQERDVTPWLRQLGMRADRARHLAALCDEMLPDASLAARVKFALQRQCPGPI